MPKRGTDALQILIEWRGTPQLATCLSEKLTPRESQILMARYATPELPSQAAVARLLGVSAGYVQKTEETALRKLCHPSVERYFQ